MKSIAQSRDELLSVPVGAHSVQLFAHPPAVDLGAAVPGFGQQQRRSISRGSFVLWLGRQGSSDSCFLRRIAPQGPKVLACPPFDGQGLVAPGWASAAVNSSHVL